MNTKSLDKKESQQTDTARSARAAIYARARITGSADDAALESQAAHRQLKRCEEEAERLGAGVVQEYVDFGSSAQDKARPGLVALLKRLQADRDVDYVIVDALDRLIRAIEDELVLVQAFKAGGAQLVIAGHGIHDLSASAVAMRTIEQVFGRLKRRELSDAAKRGWATRRANARRSGMQSRVD